jgi:hypothetical protein
VRVGARLWSLFRIHSGAYSDLRTAFRYHPSEAVRIIGSNPSADCTTIMMASQLFLERGIWAWLQRWIFRIRSFFSTCVVGFLYSNGFWTLMVFELWWFYEKLAWNKLPFHIFRMGSLLPKVSRMIKLRDQPHPREPRGKILSLVSRNQKKYPWAQSLLELVPEVEINSILIGRPQGVDQSAWSIVRQTI